jgi:hypothetical protein
MACNKDIIDVGMPDEKLIISTPCNGVIIAIQIFVLFFPKAVVRGYRDFGGELNSTTSMINLFAFRAPNHCN